MAGDVGRFDHVTLHFQIADYRVSSGEGAIGGTKREPAG
jgi:hypothetical protein